MATRQTCLQYIRSAFQSHATDRGAIRCQEKLEDRTLAAVSAWLLAEEREYRQHDMIAEAEALRDLRVNLLR